VRLAKLARGLADSYLELVELTHRQRLAADRGRSSLRVDVDGTSEQVERSLGCGAAADGAGGAARRPGMAPARLAHLTLLDPARAGFGRPPRSESTRSQSCVPVLAAYQ